MPARFNDRYISTLGKSTRVREIVVAAAEEVASNARSGAPVDTGAYRDSIHVEVDESAHRVVARVVASDEGALAIEAQTGNLARALQRSSYG